MRPEKHQRRQSEEDTVPWGLEIELDLRITGAMQLKGLGGRKGSIVITAGTTDYLLCPRMVIGGLMYIISNPHNHLQGKYPRYPNFTHKKTKIYRGTTVIQQKVTKQALNPSLIPKSTPAVVRVAVKIC